jgi:protein-S-isoprenylcysteine O-methyltransferase Ste14
MNIVFVVVLLFVPFYRKRQRLTSIAYLVFVLASSFAPSGMAGWAGGGLAAISPAGRLALYYGFLALAVCGSALVLAGWARMCCGTESRPLPPAELAEDGIYGFVRHPQYAGFLAVTVGMLIANPAALTALLWALLAWLYLRLARTEEHELERRFGGRWRAYRARVGMFVPRLRL